MKPVNYSSKKIIFVLTAVIIIAGLGWFLSSLTAKNTPETNSVKSVLPKSSGQEEATLIINNGKELNVLKADYQEGMTAFDLLKKATNELKITLESKNSNFGVFVEKIGQKKNGDGGKYWLYYVNGEMPQVASDKFILKPGDRVEFKFEKSSF